jgi:hypothetical protein
MFICLHEIFFDRYGEEGISGRSSVEIKAGIDWQKGNAEGWANFPACLKAYLEYGINGFDFHR